jgi:DNA-binding NarL/FixJ family response regulator
LIAGAVTPVITCVPDLARRNDLVLALERLGHETTDVHDPDRLQSSTPDDGRVVVVVHDGIDQWRSIVMGLIRHRPMARVVLLGSVDDPDEFLSLLTAGVAGLCRADADLEAIVRTIESVQEAGVAVPRSFVGALVEELRHRRTRRVASAAGPVEVSEREFEVLELMIVGCTTREIADQLFVSVGTIRSHIAAVVKKLGAIDREAAVALVTGDSTRHR